MPVGDALERVHVARPPVELDRHDGARARRHRRGGGVGIDQMIVTALHEHRCGARKVNGGRGRDVRVGRDDDLAPRLHPGGPERDDQPVRAIGHAVGEPHAEQRAQAGLEVAEVALQNERPPVHHIGDSLEDFGALLLEEMGVAEEGDLHRGDGGGAHPVLVLKEHASRALGVTSDGVRCPTKITPPRSEGQVSMQAHPRGFRR